MKSNVPLQPATATLVATGAALLRWYAQFGRTHLPWRRTRDPYRIVVAEFMLQQTQVERVLPLYRAFLERFPTLEMLATADAGDVLRAWRGLGYNSRAQRLRLLAQQVVRDYAGAVPRERAALRALPGIGSYTAAAVRAFAFDENDVAIDVNVRRVVHRLTLGVEFPVRAGDAELDALAASMVPPQQGHDWNSAMMDFGTMICTARAPRCLLCPLREHCAAAPIDVLRLRVLAKESVRRSPQATLPFVRTTRFLRGRVIDRLRDVPPHATLALEELQHDLARVVPVDRIVEIGPILDVLIGEGLVTREHGGVRLCN